LVLCLLFFTALLANLPKAVLAAVVLMAVRGLIDVRALVHMWRASRIDFLNAAVALVGVLLLGILQGILLAALISVLLLLALSSTPHVAFLGRIPGTSQFSDTQRHPENERLLGVLACRPEASLLYLNADYVLGRILAELDSASGGPIETVICDLSASPRMDLAGVRMLAALQEELGRRGMDLVVSNAHGRVRDLMRAEGLDQRIRGVARGNLLEGEVARATGASTPA
jgi:MFS superfamily sulfate permease-like transporter